LASPNKVAVLGSAFNPIGRHHEFIAEVVAGLAENWMYASSKTKGTVLGLLLLALVVGGAVATMLWFAAYQ
jgi:hypothetical protein